MEWMHIHLFTVGVQHDRVEFLSKYSFEFKFDFIYRLKNL